jgi:3-hydroxyacyl-CoA dehydrogenase
VLCRPISPSGAKQLWISDSAKIAEGLNTANRMMGAHYFMPAEVVPLAEILVMGQQNRDSIR